MSFYKKLQSRKDKGDDASTQGTVNGQHTTPAKRNVFPDFNECSYNKSIKSNTSTDERWEIFRVCIE